MPGRAADLANKISEKSTLLLRCAIPLIEPHIHRDRGGRESRGDRFDIQVTANEQAGAGKQYHHQRRFHHDEYALRAAMRTCHVAASARCQEHQ